MARTIGADKGLGMPVAGDELGQTIKPSSKRAESGAFGQRRTCRIVSRDNAEPRTYPDADTESRAESHAQPDTGSHADADSQSNPGAFTDACSDSDARSHAAHADSDTDANACWLPRSMNAIVPADSKSEGRARGRRWWRRAAIGLVATIALVAALFALFALNGTSDTWRKPEIGRSSGAIVTEPVSEVRVMALNVAKCWFHRGGLDFADRSELLETLDRIAETVRSESPDLLFLSEVVIESAPVALNQVEYLSRACGFAHHVSSENYSFGLPFCRIRSGNALLARFDTRALETVQLEGEFRFWNPTNNRRALFCEVQINETWLLVGSIRNDSFDLVNNLRQVEQILAYVGTRPALLAGDFNAEPTTAPIRRLAETGAFTDPVAAPATFPASAPTRRIDQILAPRAWVMREQHVVDTRVSDHLAVVATFGLR